MTNEHPITPPPELVEQWCEQLFGCPDKPEIAAYELVRLGAQWGADQELEACCEWLEQKGFAFVDEVRAARRHKPPSLKEQAKQALFRFDANAHTTADEMQDDFDLIRQALEQLDD